MTIECSEIKSSKESKKCPQHSSPLHPSIKESVYTSSALWQSDGRKHSYYNPVPNGRVPILKVVQL